MTTHSRKTILLATDQQRSVLSALDEHQPRSIAYTPYGHRPRENGLLSLLGFNGELPDPRTGCYHLGNGYRQFNPVLMRFNSPDSWSPFGEGGLNAYGYCGGDPINSTDPSAHFNVTVSLKSFWQSVKNAFKSTSKSSSEARSAVKKRSATTPTKKSTLVGASAGSTSSEKSVSSGYEPINSYENVNAVRPIDMRPRSSSLDQSVNYDIGRSHSLRELNPVHVPIHQITSNRSIHGNTKRSILKWVESTHNTPDKQLEIFVRIPRAGAGLRPQIRHDMRAFRNSM